MFALRCKDEYAYIYFILGAIEYDVGNSCLEDDFVFGTIDGYVGNRFVDCEYTILCVEVIHAHLRIILYLYTL